MIGVQPCRVKFENPKISTNAHFMFFIWLSLNLLTCVLSIDEKTANDMSKVFYFGFFDAISMNSATAPLHKVGYE